LYQLSVADNQGTIRLVTAGVIDEGQCCQVSIGALSQLFFGRLSASQLKKLGRLIAPAFRRNCFGQVVSSLHKLFE